MLRSPLSSRASSSLMTRISDPPEQLLQLAARRGDPMIHRVAADRRRGPPADRAPWLADCGSMLARNTYCASTMLARQLRLEIGEDVELQIQRVALVHVLVVAARPRARCAPNARCSPERSMPRSVRNSISSRGKSSPTAATILHRSEEAGGHRKVGRGAAQRAIDFPVRGFDGIEEHRSDDQNTHPDTPSVTQCPDAYSQLHDTTFDLPCPVP